MTRYDLDKEHPDSLQVGDEVWVGTTLYDVRAITDDEISCVRHEPLTFRAAPCLV